MPHDRDGAVYKEPIFALRGEHQLSKSASDPTNDGNGDAIYCRLSHQPSEDSSFREQILDAARTQLRRFGEAKTNVVDIAHALGTSHTTIYRHFRSKAEIFDAVVAEAMHNEEEQRR